MRSVILSVQNTIACEGCQYFWPCSIHFLQHFGGYFVLNLGKPIVVAVVLSYWKYPGLVISSKNLQKCVSFAEKTNTSGGVPIMSVYIYCFATRGPRKRLLISLGPQNSSKKMSPGAKYTERRSRMFLLSRPTTTHISGILLCPMYA